MRGTTRYHFFFFNDTATTEIYTLSLHDALPILREAGTWDEDEQTVTNTICPYCGVGCELELHVQDNAIVKVMSPSDSSVTSGHLCVKGRFGFGFVQRRRRREDAPTAEAWPAPFRRRRRDRARRRPLGTLRFHRQA